MPTDGRSNRLLSAALPDRGITTSVKDGQHNDPRRLDPKEHRIRKSTNSNSPDIAVHDRESLRILGNQTDCTFDLRCELGTETDTALFVPHR
jgi:hypothetical protein